MKVLLVEDDAPNADAAALALADLGVELSRVADGTKVIGFLQRNPVDLIILDWKLPGVSGLDILRWIRANLGAQPSVLFFTSRILEADIVEAFDAGADDYVTKPFRHRELAARVGALLRRKNAAKKTQDELSVGHYTLDFTGRVIYLRGQPVDLTEKEFDLSAILFRNVGRVISRDVIAGLAWGHAYDGSSRAMDTHISRIRRKLALNPENGMRLNSVYTHGYRLTAGNAEAEKPEQGDYQKQAA
ncbi:response regulator transcription factor [Paraburkholderia flava]|uniref:response regulator transcription factor n=1 Tax=Paraburkholderia flava TaxID=2547393 RepID=UPI001061EF68|nr:response regulator transcription factor [Paraburkholderia flava]